MKNTKTHYVKLSKSYKQKLTDNYLKELVETKVLTSNEVENIVKEINCKR